MENLINELNDLNDSIRDLENQILVAQLEAEDNIRPLKSELSRIKEDKRLYASKSDFESVEVCRRRENNLKFRIDAQWNRCSILKNDLVRLKNRRNVLEDKIRLEKDRIKRKEMIRSQMDGVLENYKKSQNLKRAAVDSNISPENVSQWFDWGKQDYDEIYSYFYEGILKIDDYFKDLKVKELLNQMDRVIEAYEMTHSLEDASRIANVSYDTVRYWMEWGSKGFGEQNTYFYKKINTIEI